MNELPKGFSYQDLKGMSNKPGGAAALVPQQLQAIKPKVPGLMDFPAYPSEYDAIKNNKLTPQLTGVDAESPFEDEFGGSQRFEENSQKNPYKYELSDFEEGINKYLELNAEANPQEKIIKPNEPQFNFENDILYNTLKEISDENRKNTIYDENFASILEQESDVWHSLMDEI